jgi:hypothetical protein
MFCDYTCSPHALKDKYSPLGQTDSPFSPLIEDRNRKNGCGWRLRRQPHPFFRYPYEKGQTPGLHEESIPSNSSTNLRMWILNV